MSNKPCPFCGNYISKVITIPTGWRDNPRVWYVECCNCESRGTRKYTEAEAIEAWNSRAPIEYDGWFYLPKPKEGIVDYCEPEMTKTENGYKVRQTVDVINEAARKWGDELGEYVMLRICEVWNTRSAGTCEITEVVRCRDCEHFEEIEGMFKWCSFHNMDVKEHDFCSKGERREND